MEELSQYFCSHCGETKTFRKTDLRAERMEKGDFNCRTCLQGTMRPVAINVEKKIFETGA
jgi:hypothetical protein